MPLLKKSPVTHWFESRFAEPTPAQKAAWPLIDAGKNVLIVSPTGTGKTFAAFLSVLNELALLHDRGELQNTIYCIYVSPLRALSYDLEKNLNEPLNEIYGRQSPIRVGLRSGDTTQSERQKQFTKPPHILLTTPESLCLLLSQEKWLPHLSSVRWIIVDEIHALAENKRGAHLSISLERLTNLRTRNADPPPPSRGRGKGGEGWSGLAPRSKTESNDVLTPHPGPLPVEGRGRTDSYGSQHFDPRLQRIGLSATVAPLNEVAQ